LNKILEESSETPGRPLIFGLRFVVGPDGIPRIQTFGNVKPSKPDLKADVFEPTVDVFESDDKVTVVVEIPGATKESIKIKAKDDELYVEAEGERKYAKRIKLPAKVDPKSAKAKFKNGILTIELKKVSKDEGVDVKVE
jgi:HSP20 family protein